MKKIILFFLLFSACFFCVHSDENFLIENMLLREYIVSQKERAVKEDTSFKKLRKVRAMVIAEARTGLLNELKKLVINSNASAGDLLKKDLLDDRFESLIDYSNPVVSRTTGSGKLSVRLVLHLNENLRSFIPLSAAGYGFEEKKDVRKIITARERNRDRRAERTGLDSTDIAVDSRKKEKSAPRDVTKYTGIVFDARGLGLEPALFPRILAADGSVLYSADHVSEDTYIEKGIVKYARDKNRKALAVAGKKPLTLKVNKVFGKKHISDLLLSLETAQKLNSISGFEYILSKARVVILY